VVGSDEACGRRGVDQTWRVVGTDVAVSDVACGCIGRGVWSYRAWRVVVSGVACYRIGPAEKQDREAVCRLLDQTWRVAGSGGGMWMDQRQSVDGSDEE